MSSSQTPKKVYGGGNPLWGGNENTRQRSSPSYQNSSYQPPNVSADYAQQQAGVMTDTLKTQYQAEGTANAVLSQMTTQRYQLQGAHDNVGQMKETTEQAKKEIAELMLKAGRKKKRLQVIIAALAITDLFLLYRLLKCGGSFICPSYNHS